ncbi:MAG: hypothetical protein A2Z21_07855 [Candidatus Fraserbacteria bacterium RBG_16_55_9]|uniref:DUF2933 domain-containing protein n=1 Tax=Fraserbacteria sp. (strain RBG_16_55_9) TaxID=1817864 RepID=A0A1F5UQA7_FRAXR|nr:MAG: hypothetical protein A2Z21_07855 [Candidatus Fraserbacteria bacterium RBG_16_55_9]
MQHHSGETSQMTESAPNQKGSVWKRWLWLAGCLAPVAAVMAVILFNLPVNTAVLAGLFLLCPLTHFFLMRGEGHRH